MGTQVTITLDLDRLRHRLKRLVAMRDKMQAEQSGNENNFTYWSGFELGYIKGKINEIDELICLMEVVVKSDFYCHDECVANAAEDYEFKKCTSQCDKCKK